MRIVIDGPLRLSLERDAFRRKVPLGGVGACFIKVRKVFGFEILGVEFLFGIAIRFLQVSGELLLGKFLPCLSDDSPALLVPPQPPILRLQYPQDHIPQARESLPPGPASYMGGFSGTDLCGLVSRR